MTGRLVEMRGIRKSFGHVEALRGVDFDVGYGEIVGLIGDNGAGKSTLVKVLTGVYPPDEGEIFFDGKRVSFSSPADARAEGIETVYQGYGVAELLNIARNFFLGREPVKKFCVFKLLDHQKMFRECSRILSEIGISVRSPLEPTGVLSGGERQAINIGRAMYFKAKLIILDEPTNALSVKETEHVLQFIERTRQTGTSVIFITHNIYHVCRVADRFVLLERGKKIGDYRKDEVTPEDIIRILTVGKSEKSRTQNEEC
uniref:Sugar ABC transporter ATP-binding protein n=1 Tax=Candidatus Caldatribacterium californiense TaxID=1454726 RepID=A0A7V3YF92_9BACT